MSREHLAVKAGRAEPLYSISVSHETMQWFVSRETSLSLQNKSSELFSEESVQTCNYNYNYTATQTKKLLFFFESIFWL